ncbi:hypothetical protein ES702_00331 [subsurface metagenome]
MNLDEQKRLFSWRSFKLVMPGLYIFNLISSQNSIELNTKSQEPDGLKEIHYTWDYENWDKFFRELEKFNRGVIRIKDFKDKFAIYNLGEKLQTNLFFTREQWVRFFEFVSSAFKAFEDQRKIFAGF